MRLVCAHAFSHHSLVYTIAGASCLVDPSLDALVVSRLVLGLAAGAAATKCTALAGVWYEGDRRKNILGYAHAVSSLYNIVILIAGAWLVDHIGWRAPSWFYMVGLITFICAGIATAGSGRQPIGHSAATGSSKLRPLWPLYLLTLLFAFDACMPLIQGPFLLSGAGWQDATSQSIAIVSLLVTTVISSASSGRPSSWCRIGPGRAYRSRWHMRGSIATSSATIGKGLDGGR